MNFAGYHFSHILVHENRPEMDLYPRKSFDSSAVLRSRFLNVFYRCSNHNTEEIIAKDAV